MTDTTLRDLKRLHGIDYLEAREILTDGTTTTVGICAVAFYSGCE